MNDSTHITSFDFDEWQQLAKANPAAFEVKRHETITQFLEQLAPEQRHRLEKLQWRIDMERKRSATPMSALLKIYDRMMTSLHQQKAALDSFLNDNPAPETPSKAMRKNTVIDLKPRCQ
ncbi:MAG: hypothetical protein AXA67_01130 [Methylothermaceae bacteria B42]|nr:MAG: hypothetical protein AXA67_01130 [Methylothermaceae bacteria B42]HHJ40482.1 DUF3135 domain-containing protein [Methylothermaceae bacterium]